MDTSAARASGSATSAAAAPAEIVTGVGDGAASTAQHPSMAAPAAASVVRTKAIAACSATVAPAARLLTGEPGTAAATPETTPIAPPSPPGTTVPSAVTAIPAALANARVGRTATWADATRPACASRRNDVPVAATAVACIRWAELSIR